MSEPLEPSDELDRRIEAGLRRRFEPPAALAALPARVAARRRRRRTLQLLGAALAAGVLGLLFWRGSRPDAPAPRGRYQVQRFATSTGVVPASCQLVGPLEEGREPERMQVPDLVALYRAMDACQRSSAAVACSVDDALVERLRASYGPDVKLRPDAAGLLHGPFASTEWSTGTILTGSSEDVTSVLVAERDSTLDCCVRPRLTADSGLNVFTWNVGDLALTEITQHAEPRFLELFE